MSAVDGIPVDKCPKCGMDYVQKNWMFACGSDRGVGLYGRQSFACKRIAELQAECEIKDSAIKYWHDLATEMQAKAVERCNKLRECRLEIERLTERVRGLTTKGE